MAHYMQSVSNNESHYTVLTAWISAGGRVRVKVDSILQNIAPLYIRIIIRYIS